MPSRTLLVAAGEFDDLSAERVAEAVSRGLRDGGWQTDGCAIDAPAAGGVRALLDLLGFDERMRSSRALVVCERCLREDTLAGSVAFEIATRARQSGVPGFAVTAENRLDSFDTRVLDLQAIVPSTGSARSLRAAGRKLAALV
jgi:glycerate kinase